MFWIFKNDNIELWSQFIVSTKNYLEVKVTIITIDNDIIWVCLEDNYNKIWIMSHIPITKKAFKQGKMKYVWKCEELSTYSLEWYEFWKKEKWGVFTVTIQDLLDWFPTNRLFFTYNDSRVYGLTRHQWVSTKSIFNTDWSDIVSLAPQLKRVLYPSIGFGEGDFIINDFDFIELKSVQINDKKIYIWFYDYSKIIYWHEYDVEMFNFNYENLSWDIVKILQIIKNIDIEILDFENEFSIGLNDSGIEYDENGKLYKFTLVNDEYYLDKYNSELLINTYKDTLHQFIHNKKIDIKINAVI